MFTSNRAKANPVIWSEQVIRDGHASAIILNAGGANCFTGAFGFQTTHQTAEAVADITSSGETLRANNLKILGEEPILRSQATLFANRAALGDVRPFLAQLGVEA